MNMTIINLYYFIFIAGWCKIHQHDRYILCHHFHSQPPPLAMMRLKTIGFACSSFCLLSCLSLSLSRLHRWNEMTRYMEVPGMMELKDMYVAWWYVHGTAQGLSKIVEANTTGKKKKNTEFMRWWWWRCWFDMILSVSLMVAHKLTYVYIIILRCYMICICSAKIFWTKPLCLIPFAYCWCVQCTHMCLVVVAFLFSNKEKWHVDIIHFELSLFGFRRPI